MVDAPAYLLVLIIARQSQFNLPDGLSVLVGS
jgi:hypothetical protein